jgi:hypothetical protein
VVANGRVYVATFSQELVVYGLLPGALGSPLGKWQQAGIPVKVAGLFQVEGTASTSCGRFTIWERAATSGVRRMPSDHSSDGW